MEEQQQQQQEHERRREATKLLVNVGAHPYLTRDGQSIPRDRYASIFYLKFPII